MTFEKIKTDMYAAMKAKDKVRKDTLATLIDNAKKAAIDKKEDRDNVSEATVDAVILREKKLLQEMIAGCPEDTEQHRNLKKEYEAKLAIILEYAPQTITDENEIRKIVMESGVELNKKNMGKIMGLLKGKKCDMGVANKVVNAMIADAEN